MLAATYGMSGATAGARLGYTGKEAREKGEELLGNFFSGFKGVKTAIDNSKLFLKQNGYVEDFLGRRRHLDDINLPKYEVRYADKTKMEENTFNPILGCSNRIDTDGPISTWQQLIDMYIIYSQLYQFTKAQKDNRIFNINSEMSKDTFEWLKKIASNPAAYLNQNWMTSINKDKTSVSKYSKITEYTNKQKIEADKESFKLLLSKGIYKNNVIEVNNYTKSLFEALDNYKTKYGETVPALITNEPMQLLTWTGKIAQAERQCFNARIQGSAASLTKMAMVDIHNDNVLNELGAHLIITVHDEVLVECPAEYADLVEKRLPEIMIDAAKKGGDQVPQACDPYNVSRWYCDTAAATIMDEFKKLEAKGITRDEAIAKVAANHTEVPEAAIIKTIETGCDLEF